MQRDLSTYLIAACAAVIVLALCSGCLSGLSGLATGTGSSNTGSSQVNYPASSATLQSGTGSGAGSQGDVYTCPGHPEMTACSDGYCYNLATDPLHCGSCSHACSGTQTCSRGQCVAGTGTANTKPGVCNGLTVDLNSSSSNCGKCNYRCNSAQTCVGGKCVEPTPQVPAGQDSTGQGSAGTTPVPVTTTPTPTPTPIPFDPCAGMMSCISCYDPAANVYNVCSPGQTCSNGACAGSSSTEITKTPVPAPTEDPCKFQKGMTNCDGRCYNLNTDPFHCGGCSKVCALGQSCSGGVCGCPPDKPTFCGGACVDTTTDTSNCGGCGKPCPSGSICTKGECLGQIPTLSRIRPF